MIDLVQYRYRIGSFRPGHCSKNSFKRFIFSYEFSLKESQNCMNTIELMLRKKLSQSLYLCSFLLVLVLLILAGVLFIIRYEGCQSVFNPINLWLPFNRVKHNIYVGNFWARYVNGNRQSGPKGIRSLHLNIRSLRNKCD